MSGVSVIGFFLRRLSRENVRRNALLHAVLTNRALKQYAARTSC